MRLTKQERARLAELLRQYADSDAWERSLIEDADVELLHRAAKQIEDES